MKPAGYVSDTNGSQMVSPHQVVRRRPDGSVDVATENVDKDADCPTQVQQQFKDECDVNNIMKKHINTGTWRTLTAPEGPYADFSEITDFHGMVLKVQSAQEAFMALPAQTRARFRNDPGQLIEFLNDNKNYEEAVKLGLVDRKVIAPNDDKKLNTNDDRAKTKTKSQPKSSSSELDDSTES